MVRDPRLVVALAYDRLCTFEFGIVVEIFGLPRPELEVPWYRFQVAALERRPLTATGGVTVSVRAGLALLRRAGTIVLPGWRDPDERPPEAVCRAVRAAYQGGARLVSICSGVFVLAAAGLLDERRCTTHWRYAARLAAAYPAIRVEPDVLYTEDGDGRLFTSAGSAAGIDVCLHIVRKDHGAAVANQVARRLVVPPQRDGGQSQYVPAPIREGGAGGLARIMDWAGRHLDQQLGVVRMARHAALSPRTFARRFRAETGTTPHRWLVHQRLLAAQQRLETTTDAIDEVARAVGLGSAATLQHHFRRELATTPTDYRRRFSVRSARASRRRRDR